MFNTSLEMFLTLINIVFLYSVFVGPKYKTFLSSDFKKTHKDIV